MGYANSQTDVDQTAGGAAGVVTGTAAGQSSGATTSEQSHAMMSDVNVQELMSGMNGLVNQMAVNLQASLNTVAIQTATSNQFYNSLLNQMAVDHRDQNHTKQALATTFPFVVAGDAAEESANDTDRR